MNFFLDIYIQSMSKEDLKNLAQQKRIYFTEKEIDSLYPVIKNSWRDYFDSNKQNLKNKIIKLTSIDCLNRVENLIASIN